MSGTPKSSVIYNNNSNNNGLSERDVCLTFRTKHNSKNVNKNNKSNKQNQVCEKKPERKLSL